MRVEASDSVIAYLSQLESLIDERAAETRDPDIVNAEIDGTRIIICKELQEDILQAAGQ